MYKCQISFYYVFSIKNGILLYKRGEVLLRKCYLCGEIEKEKKCIRWNCLGFAPNAVRLLLW